MFSVSMMFAQGPSRQIEIPIVLGCASLPEGSTFAGEWEVSATFFPNPEPSAVTKRATAVELGRLKTANGDSSIFTKFTKTGPPLLTRSVSEYLRADPKLNLSVVIDEDKIPSSSGNISLRVSGKVRLTTESGFVAKDGPCRFIYLLRYPEEKGAQGYIQALGPGNASPVDIIIMPILVKENMNPPKK
jgi:hypothetical protein